MTLPLGDVEKALDALERGAEERSRFVVFAGVWPAFEVLRGEPRFARLLARMGLGTSG